MTRLASSCLTAALAVLAIVSCRDAAEPFRPIDRGEVDPSRVRLTYGAGDDRSPVWSAAGDSIYYTSTDWEGNPLAPATVLALPADGMGSATTLLRNVQEGARAGNWITAPAVAADGERIAFIRVLPLLSDSPCSGTRVCPTTSHLPMVRLIAAELHARRIDASDALEEDVILPLAFEGHDQIPDGNAPGGVLTVSEYHPFQFEFEENGRAFFRPAWSPDGNELVVSDGLRLLRWTLGATSATVIPGTEDGMMPAWSPDGAWIAWAHYARSTAQTFQCEYQNEYPGPSGPVTVTDCLEQRTMHYAAPPVIVVSRPDGSDARMIGLGTDPAWALDGASVYAAAPGGIVRLALDGAAPEVIPGTESGIEPAVSPDGTRLAFSRRASLDAASHDIWVVTLP